MLLVGAVVTISYIIPYTLAGAANHGIEQAYYKRYGQSTSETFSNLVNRASHSLAERIDNFSNRVADYIVNLRHKD